MELKVTQAPKSKLIVPTGFGAYDYCINPYIGCSFACRYCYVRFFVKDKTAPWGEFVRTRDHIHQKIAKELLKCSGHRLVIGTMTDPYQPIERKQRLTRTILEAIQQLDVKDRPSQIGIFTRSPIVRDDINIIRQLDSRVHITITPFSEKILKRIEPIPVSTEARFRLAEDLIKVGIRIHLSISPVLPVYSDPFTTKFADRIAQIKPNGFTIDPMQVYGEALEATQAACGDDPDWPSVLAIISDKDKYNEWKQQYIGKWKEAWAKYKDLAILPISMDHQAKTRRDLRDDSKIDFKNFNYS